jgi:uncharacterized protein YukE
VAKANVDPEDLMRFAKSLMQFNRSMQEMSVGLRGQMRQLEATWQDQEQVRFTQEFNDAIRVLDRLAEANEQHAQVLTKKARHIQAYLDA